VELTTKEYSLLEYLMSNAGRVLSRTMIIEHVWDQSFAASPTSWTFMCATCATKSMTRMSISSSALSAVLVYTISNGAQS